MLLNLCVKNLALIDEIEIDFTDGLNILTGETGAGKSIIIGSINIALGNKVNKDIIRNGKDYALVELVFKINENDVKIRQVLNEFDIELDEENKLIISRKIFNNKTITKINGENITINKLKEISSLLIDIHGQHEHQSLLHKNKHLEILDKFAYKDIQKIKKELLVVYSEYKKIKDELNENQMDEEKRLREINFLEYEIKEIEDAKLIIGEDEELFKLYKKMSNSKEIVEELNNIYLLTAYQNQTSAGNFIGKALTQLLKLENLDEELSSFKEQLENIDSLLNDFNRDISNYMQDMTFDEQIFNETEIRLDLINSLKNKYGDSIEKILEYKQEICKKYEKLLDYESYVQKLNLELSKKEKELDILSEELSQNRKKYAKILSKNIKNALIDLNFLDVQFEIKFSRLSEYTQNGIDDICFMISTNIGQKIRPIQDIASGGELSRIMLALKSVLADEDSIETLIFDEIDTGISGRTAQRVSEKLNQISRKHQVICITHLPQIASMADKHFMIEKLVKENQTITDIYSLDDIQIINELARLIGGVEITDTVIKSAKEMKLLANSQKSHNLKN